MAAENAFTWGSLATPLEHQLEHYGIDPHVGIDVLFTSTLLILLAYVGGRKFRSADVVMPSGRLDFSTFIEIAVGGVYNFTKGLLGHLAKPYFWFTGSLAFFILFNNLLGLVPGFNPPTDQFNTTIVLGLLVIIMTIFIGLRYNGMNFIIHFAGPVWWLSWLIFPLELISFFVRPISLALRLFGNILGDHKVGMIFFGILPLVLPLPFLGLGLFVSFVQTLVFLLLTCIYFQMAAAHDDH